MSRRSFRYACDRSCWWRSWTRCAIPNLPLIYSNSVPNLLVITRLMRGYRHSDLMSQHKQLDEIVATALRSTETSANRKKVMREIQEKLKCMYS